MFGHIKEVALEKGRSKYIDSSSGNDFMAILERAASVEWPLWEGPLYKIK